MDRYGLDIFLPTEQRQKTVLAIDWFPLEVQDYLKANEVPDWSMTFLFERVIPELKERGMTDEQLEQMMIENPNRWPAT